MFVLPFFFLRRLLLLFWLLCDSLCYLPPLPAVLRTLNALMTAGDTKALEQIRGRKCTNTLTVRFNQRLPAQRVRVTSPRSLRQRAPRQSQTRSSTPLHARLECLLCLLLAPSDLSTSDRQQATLASYGRNSPSLHINDLRLGVKLVTGAEHRVWYHMASLTSRW